MSATRIVERLLRADPKVTDNVGIGMIPQPTEPPFIVITHVYEGQQLHLARAVDHFDTRVSVEIISRNAIECDQQAAAVIACLSSVIHEDVSRVATDVCIAKAGSDVLDYNDEREVYRRIIDFSVRWKP